MSSAAAATSTPLSEGASSVGLGYGIAIAVGILVLVSTIMLASYVSVRSMGGGHRSSPPTTTSSSASTYPEPEVVLVVGGLDAPTIESYPKFVYSGRGHAGGGRPEQQGGSLCSICLGDYVAGEVLRRMPDCKHCFHAGCVDEWLRMSATCPMCRQSPGPSPIATPLSELIPLALHAR